MTETSQAALYGRGIFTTIRIFDGQLFLWDKHWRRLTDNAEKVGVDLCSFSQDGVTASVVDAIKREGINDGRVRVTFCDERSSEIWPGDFGSTEATKMSIVPGPHRPVMQPFRCSVSPFTINSRSPLAGIKSCNYLENILAIEDAKRRGYSEAVRLNERGHVAGACMANVFWLKGGRLYTPASSTGCLPGTTREFVLENIACEEVEAGIGEIETADALFLTSAGLGVVAVDEFNGRQLAAAGHAILRLI